MSDSDRKLLASTIVGAIAGFAAMQLTYALLAWAIWSWLALVIALLVSLVASFAAGAYTQASGYDLAVEGAARAVTFFRGLRAKVSA